MPTVSIILQDAVDESAVIDLQLGNYIKGNDGPQGDKGDKGDTGDVTPAALAAQAAAEAAQAAAETAETNAAASASSASTSEANAAASASSASTAATNAGNSATSSAISASNAATSETNAASSASSASTSASSASASASSASTSASTATTQASNASASASAAATSAANAATSETNAAASAASAAATSAQYATRSPDLIINPHGSIQQETTTPVTTNGTYYADQWLATFVASTGAFQAGVTTGTGSSYDPSYMFYKTTTAKAVLAAGDIATMQQPIEGNYARRLLYGGASARSSWVRWQAWATQSATASIAIRNAAANRSFVHAFSVTTTPTAFSLSVPGDTTGSWPTDTSKSATVDFCHASGTTFQTSTLDAWQAGDFRAATTQTNLLGTLNAQLNITDVSWKDSAVLLPFIPIDYQQELERCQRYVQKIGREGSGTLVGGASCTGSVVIGGLPLNTPMRTTPTWSGGTLQFFTPAGAVNATIAYDTNVNHVTLSASQTNTNGHSGYVISTATTGFRGLLARM